MNTGVHRALLLALVLSIVVNSANFDWAGAASSAPPEIVDGSHILYRFVDVKQPNRTEYMYVEFVEIHEHMAEVAIRTGLTTSDGSDWSQHPSLYGYLDFESGSLTLVGTTGKLALSFWINPQSIQSDAASGFPPDSMEYSQLDCAVYISSGGQQRSWYDKVTGVLIQTSFLSANVASKVAVLYETNIPVGGRVAVQWTLPIEIPSDMTTYSTLLIVSVAVIAVAAIALIRSRRRRKTSRRALEEQCLSCGYKNRRGAVFCSRCGSSLAAPAVPVMKPERGASAAPTMSVESYAGVSPVVRPEPPVSAVTPPREYAATTVSPLESRNVCRNCGHVNPDWIMLYCVRCAARLQMD